MRGVPRIGIQTNKDVPNAMQASFATVAPWMVPVETWKFVLQAKIVVLAENQRMEVWFPSADCLELLDSGQRC